MKPVESVQNSSGNAHFRQAQGKTKTPAVVGDGDLVVYSKEVTDNQHYADKDGDDRIADDMKDCSELLTPELLESTYLAQPSVFLADHSDVNSTEAQNENYYSEYQVKHYL